MTMQYKILKDMRSCHGGEWRYVPGEWTPDVKPVVCQKGWHTVDEEHLLEWLFNCDSVWECEVRGENDYMRGDKTAWESICITKQVMSKEDIWNLRADIVGRVLPIYERKHPGDSRVRDCIDIMRRYGLGEATDDELSSASWAAYDAANAAAANAANAAYAAAYAAARGSLDAYESAVHAANAIFHAAKDNANDPNAAYTTEREWQKGRLTEYLKGRYG